MTSSESQARESSPSATLPRALQLHADDNVVVALQHTTPGRVVVLGSGEAGTVEAGEAIANGHKIAVRSIATGEPIVKYGVTIGMATEPIATGAWVHTHNCRSRIDERSHTLDVHTGAPTDTQYL